MPDPNQIQALKEALRIQKDEFGRSYINIQALQQALAELMPGQKGQNPIPQPERGRTNTHTSRAYLGGSLDNDFGYTKTFELARQFKWNSAAIGGTRHEISQEFVNELVIQLGNKQVRAMEAARPPLTAKQREQMEEDEKRVWEAERKRFQKEQQYKPNIIEHAYVTMLGGKTPVGANAEQHAAAVKGFYEVAEKMGIKPLPRLIIFEHNMPMAAMIPLTQNIIISSRLLEFPPNELKSVFAHELAHIEQIKRKGLWGMKFYFGKEKDADTRSAEITSPDDRIASLKRYKDIYTEEYSKAKNLPDWLPESVKKEISELAKKSFETNGEMSEHGSINERIQRLEQIKHNNSVQR